MAEEEKKKSEWGCLPYVLLAFLLYFGYLGYSFYTAEPKPKERVYTPLDRFNDKKPEIKMSREGLDEEGKDLLFGWDKNEKEIFVKVKGGGYPEVGKKITVEPRCWWQGWDDCEEVDEDEDGYGCVCRKFDSYYSKNYVVVAVHDIGDVLALDLSGIGGTKNFIFIETRQQRAIRDERKRTMRLYTDVMLKAEDVEVKNKTK